MNELTSPQEKLLSELFDANAIRFGEFKLKMHDTYPTAPLSPIYIDLRVPRRLPEVKKAVVDVYEELLRPLSFDLLADIPTAATPYVSSLSDRLHVGQITPRSDNKKHGSGAQIDGMLVTDKGLHAVLVDDLLTGADSKIESIQTLRNAGVVVTDIVVLIDREQGGREKLKKEDVLLHNAFSLKQMLSYYVLAGKISDEDSRNITKRLGEIQEFVKKA